MAADPENGRDGAEDQHDHRGRHGRASAHAAHGSRESLLDTPPEALAVQGLMGKGLHRADRIQRFVHIGADVGDAVLAFARQAAHTPAEKDDRQQHQRYDQQHQSGQLGRGDHQQGQAADEQQNVAQGDRDRTADHDLQNRGVGGQAGQNLAGPVDLEISRREGDNPVEDGTAHIRHHPLADPGDQKKAGVGGAGEHYNHTQQHQYGLVEQCRVAGREALVHQHAQALAQRQHRAGGHDQRCRGQTHLQAIGPHEAPQRCEHAQIAALRPVALTQRGRGRRKRCRGTGSGRAGTGHRRSYRDPQKKTATRG